jgi:ABC-type Fe3+-hydroxamate transport system substrate-binding protein
MTDSTLTYQFNWNKPVDYVPQRVVSLVPSVTESLFDLNIGGRVVGITDYCTRPADAVKHLPRVGGTKNPDIEKIIALHPDLVIMNQEENRKPDADALVAADIPIWVTHPNTVRDALNLLWTMMDLFEEPSMVPRVRLIEVAHEWTLGAVAELPPKRAFVPIWRDPWMTFNKDTYVHDLLRICGVLNIFGERERRFPLEADLGTQVPLAVDDARIVEADIRYPRLSLDEVVAAQPDIILLPDEPYAFTQADADELSQLDIPAAKNKQIHLVDGSLLTWHGTRLAYALRDLPPLLGTISTEGM